MKVIIAGTRDFNDYEFLCKVCDHLLKKKEKEFIEIVSGTAKGADALGERYAKERGLGLKLFPAEWDTYGKAAGYKRNAQMALYADVLIAFWDGKSRGTNHMINLAKERSLDVRIIDYSSQKTKDMINAIIELDENK